MNLKDYRRVVDRIYASGYFTNHGPLAKELEDALQDFFAIKNAVIVGNESLAIIMALAGLNLTGRVGVSALGPEFVFSAVTWAGLEPVRADGDSPPDDVVAVLVCDRPGAKSAAALLRCAKANGLTAVVYQHGYFARSLEGDNVVTVATIGEAAGAPSAHCAAILTTDEILAEKYRNIRSSYGTRKTVDVRATANGRVSEFQAGMALLFLQKHGNQ